MIIKINLLPEGIKDRLNKTKEAKYKLNTRMILYIVPFIIGLLICTHLYLGVLFLINKVKYANLNKKWQSFASQRNQLESFNKEYKAISEDAKINQELLNERIIWSEKLNKLSLYLPNGIWFTRLSASPQELLLYGSVISLEKEEMSSIKKFIDSLKKDDGFYNVFGNLELGSVKSRNISGYEVVDFVLSGKLKAK